MTMEFYVRDFIGDITHDNSLDQVPLEKMMADWYHYICYATAITEKCLIAVMCHVVWFVGDVGVSVVAGDVIRNQRGTCLQPASSWAFLPH